LDLFLNLFPFSLMYLGFFIEILSFFTGLVPFFEKDKLFLDIGRCSHFNTFTDKDSAMLKSLQTSFSASPPEWTESIVIHHKLPGQAIPPALSSSHYLIGRMMTEGSVMSKKEVHQARVLDEIWVPSAFHASVFAVHLPHHKIHVMPEAVDVQFYSDSLSHLQSEKVGPQSSTLVPNGTFRFLSVFKYEKRKGLDILLSSYWQTFQKDDPVKLVIRAYKPSWEPGPSDLNKVFNSFALKHFGRHRSELASLVWLQHDLTKFELRSLYQSADIFVLPTRGEGWCLPCAEALAAGTPLIVTNFSGPAAYLTESHSFPLNYASELNSDGTAEPNKAHLSQLMRYVVDNPNELVEKGLKAKEFAEIHFKPSVVALKIISRLNIINKELIKKHSEL
jgi:glycosyltransferase involved in cell wall biosynthesis